MTLKNQSLCVAISVSLEVVNERLSDSDKTPEQKISLAQEELEIARRLFAQLLNNTK